MTRMAHVDEYSVSYSDLLPYLRDCEIINVEDLTKITRRLCPPGIDRLMVKFRVTFQQPEWLVLMDFFPKKRALSSCLARHVKEHFLVR